MSNESLPNVQDIIDYESGDMEWDRLVDFFQNLIDTGMAWTLQGSYGRVAQNLIDEGYCERKEAKK
jgi:hypothetical protein|tara:strand:+ start:46 stop:243 length:198 start_codon:yes stop_codon:yes gene_type:complete